ncbi:MAG: hypothetical protein ABIU05_11310 [Nitrospirales bacterium]
MKRMHRGSGLVLGMLWLLMADVATAGDYVLMVGKGIEVCQAYLKNLNSFPNDPPMVCERKVNPKFPEFSTPIWQPLDALERFDLLAQVERQRPSYREEEYVRHREKIMAWLKERIATGQIRLATTDLDIEQGGTITTQVVLQYTFADCDPMNESHFAGSAGRTLYVLNAERTQLDVEKSKNISYLGRADVFLYKNRVHLTQWGGNMGFKDGTLSVLPPLGGINSFGLCRYRYKASPNRRHP